LIVVRWQIKEEWKLALAAAPPAKNRSLSRKVPL
jgi:hypothetical protein